MKAVTIAGNSNFSDDDILGQMATKGRPWYQLWKERPSFDPATFSTDIERVKRFYQVHGYYLTRIDYDLTVADNLVTAHIEVTENQPIEIASIKVEVKNHSPPPKALQPSLKLPMEAGHVFDEGVYQQTEQALRDLYLDHGFAHADVQRKAEVHVGPNKAYAWYAIEAGPKAIFGPSKIEGAERINPKIIRRELTYHAGERFSPQKLKQSRDNVLKLGLFSAVQFNPVLDKKNPYVVPIVIRVHERPWHELRFSVGYNTETLWNLQAEWRDYNFTGGGRRLSLLATYSDIRRFLGVTLVQPYLFSRNSAGVLDYRQEQQTYQTYTLNASRFDPRIEYRFTRQLSGFIGYRLEYLKFNSVSPATIAALGGIRRQGLHSGPSLGLTFNTTDQAFYPKRGEVLTIRADQAGAIWGGDYKYYQVTTEAKKYQLLAWDTVLAGRLKIGIADTFGPHRDIPLSERFYSGGEGGVRGYGLRRIGPLSASDDPLGGLSLVEASLELRHPIWGPINGAVFLDAGQVSPHAYRLPFDALQYGAGSALSFVTPVGPVRLDIGFPFQRPNQDSWWQLYFSIGQFF